MNTDALIEAVKKAGMGEHEALVRKLVKQGFRLLPKPDAGEPATGSSHLGGLPDLAGQPWPTYQDTPMEFVAQVALADLATHGVSVPLPSSGHLCFFRSMQWEWSDFVEGDEVYQLARVIHVDAPVGELTRSEPAYQEYSDEFVSNIMAPRVYDAVCVEVTPTVTLPSYASAFTPEDATDTVEALHNALYAASQDDDEGQLHHMFTHMTEGDFVDAMSQDDVLLLQLGSDDAAGFMWGDMGFLYFVTPRAALEASDFDKVRIYNGVG